MIQSDRVETSGVWLRRGAWYHNSLTPGCAFGCILASTGKAQAELGTSAARGALLSDQFKVLDSRAPKLKEDMLTLQTSRFPFRQI